MRTRLLLFAAVTITLLALATVVTVLFNTTPQTATILLFYGSAFVAVFSLAFLGHYGFFWWRFRAALPWRIVYAGLRLAAIIGALGVVLLVMSAYDIFTLATFLIVLILAVMTGLIWRRRRPL